MKRQILIGVGVLIGVTGSSAQMRVEYGEANFQFAGVVAPEGRSFGVESLGSQVVMGKPFSATEERHSIQVLGDGTRIENSETNRLFRDEQGRTRIERKGGNISVFDPVAGFSAELNPSTKTVSKTTVLVREGRIVGKTNVMPAIAGSNPEALYKLKVDQEELSALQGQYGAGSPRIVELKAQIADLEKAIAAQNARSQTPGAAIDQLKGLTFNYQAEYAARNGKTPAQEDVLKKQAEAQLGATQTLLYKTEAPMVFHVDPGQPEVVLRVDQGDNASVNSLPSQMVNGALAQGTRTTETIPAGKIGNDRPISVVNERWYSNDLQMLVKSTSSDPRFGDTTYQLTGIVQASPDPSLFQIPADYTIRK